MCCSSCCFFFHFLRISSGRDSCSWKTEIKALLTVTVKIQHLMSCCVVTIEMLLDRHWYITIGFLSNVFPQVQLCTECAYIKFISTTMFIFLRHVKKKKKTQHFFLSLKKPQYLHIPPLKKISVWQLSYVFALLLFSLCFWHCQYILQYAAVPLIIFWSTLARMLVQRGCN